MRFIIIIYLLITPLLSYSQFFVGETKEFVVSVFEESHISFTDDILSDTTSRISWYLEDQFQLISIVNQEGIVFKQTLIPEGENGTNEIVKWFNDDFVKVSDVEWLNYENGRIYKIELIHILSEPLFSITLSSESK